jgi:hypothetical protein
MNISPCSKKIFLPVILLVCFGFTGSEDIRFNIAIDNEYNALFTRNKGWTGGDIAQTVSLTDSLTLWLFGDSWIGDLKNNTHSGSAMIRTAFSPEGPWSEQTEIYRAPETGWSKNYFCYAGRAHIDLSGSDDLLVSYICNSFHFAEMVSDTRIYRPKFIRIKFE